MFTGIIREVGTLVDMDYRGETAHARIQAPLICQYAEWGDSICTQGTCLTISDLKEGSFGADLSSETLHRTTFQSAHPGDRVNLEPALRPGDRLGGHIVTGHVDGIGRVHMIEEQGEFGRWVVEFPDELSAYIALKGSLCVDGISLTVSALHDNLAEFALVPFTLQNTTIQYKNPGDHVNLEVDIIARYVERLLQKENPSPGSGLSVEKLRQWGFINE